MTEFSRRPRILALSYLFPNQAIPHHGIFVFNRLNALSKYADIKVINPIPWSPLHRFISTYKGYEDIPRRTTLGNLEVFHPRFFSIPRVLKGVEIGSYARAVKNTIAKDLVGFDFDLLDVHWTFPDLPAAMTVSKEHRRPYYVTLRGLEALHLSDSDVRSTVVAKGIKSADGVVSLSEELRQHSLKCGAHTDRSWVVRNGVDVDTFYWLSMDEARQYLGLPSDERFIVMVGSLIHRKGFDLVIRALPELLKQYPDVNLRIVGAKGHEGDYSKSLNALIDEVGVRDHVHFQGKVNNEALRNWYNAADVFCLASRGEGSPNVLTEALATGCVCVASNVGSVQEIMNSEPDLGYVFENESADQLLTALRESLASNKDRKNQSEVFRKYSWDWCAQKCFHRLML